ncbi:MAG: AraC family transcriptional regulator [Lachnospiraceae bacterium]|nr:AraC family transcriptional regulator [Lachnospiraceae bacterium]
MQKNKEETILINRETGILQKSGRGFHSANEFARKHLIHAAWSGRYLCDRSYQVKREYLDYFSLIYVISGKMAFAYEDRTVTVSENEAILLDFRRPHQYGSLTDRVEKWELIFEGDISEAYYDLIAGNWGNTFRVQGRVKSVLERMMKELEEPLPDDYEISLLFHSLFTWMIRDHQLTLSGPIRKALDFMNDHVSERLKINDVADFAGLSRSYFSRLFCRETGQTPYDYMMEARINRAKQLLALDRLPVADVAEQCGFTDTSHFIRVFRERTGQTPASFRNFFT